jgi:hypothetical protein
MGSAYLHTWNGTTWSVLRKIDDDTGQSGGFFGHTLALMDSILPSADF